MRVDKQLEIGANVALVGLVLSAVAFEHFPVFGLLAGAVSVSASALVIWRRIGLQPQVLGGEQGHVAQASPAHFSEHALSAVKAPLPGAVPVSKAGLGTGGPDYVLAGSQGRLDVIDERSRLDDKELDLLKEYVHDTLTKGLLAERNLALEVFLSSRALELAAKRSATDGKSKTFRVIVRRQSKWSDEVVPNFGCVPARLPA